LLFHHSIDIFIQMKTLVLGIGNTLLSDEGVGVHVTRHLQTLMPFSEDIEILDGGTLSFTLAVPIEDADALIVVDAAQLKSAPGTLHVFEGEAMDTFLLGNRRSSVHEVSLTDLMSIACLAGHWPERRALLAIQPEKVDWGEMPTPMVQSAIPEACRRIEALLEEWHALH
jgi:hydrogenase maturation protease